MTADVAIESLRPTVVADKDSAHIELVAYLHAHEAMQFIQAQTSDLANSINTLGDLLEKLRQDMPDLIRAA